MINKLWRRKYNTIRHFLLSTSLWVFFLFLSGCVTGRSSEKQQGIEDLPSIGFFYFKEYLSLHQPSITGSFVRIPIVWDEFEPKQGDFNFGPSNVQGMKIAELLEKNYQILPTFRTRSSWAVEKPEARCSSLPLDLDRKSPIIKGRSYSKTYSAFVTKFAKQYKGKFKIVTFENEQNDPQDQFCGSADEFERLLSTFIAAYKAVDESVLISDGGLQGHTLNTMVLKHYVDKNDYVSAIAFYERFMGRRPSKESVKTHLDGHVSKKDFKRAVQLFLGSSYDWVDIVNFHYYQRAEGLPEVLKFIRTRIKNKPLMTNEIGIKNHLAKDPEEASQQMVKKVSYLLASVVRPNLWFSPDGKEGKNIGSFINSKRKLVLETTSSFETLSRLLGKVERGSNDLSNEKLIRFRFRSPTSEVHVLWSKISQAVSVSISSGCKVLDHHGNPQSTGLNFQVSEAPIFLVCTLNNLTDW